MTIWHHGEGNSISNLVISPDTKQTNASVVTMIIATSSLFILLIFLLLSPSKRGCICLGLSVCTLKCIVFCSCLCRRGSVAARGSGSIRFSEGFSTLAECDVVVQIQDLLKSTSLNASASPVICFNRSTSSASIPSSSPIRAFVQLCLRSIATSFADSST